MKTYAKLYNLINRNAFVFRPHYEGARTVSGSEISVMEQRLRTGSIRQDRRFLQNAVHQLNLLSIQLLNGLIEFKEAILSEVGNLNIFNAKLDYKELLAQAKRQDCQAMDELTRQSLEETLKYLDFKTAGAEGILSGSIASIILPLLADHVLREANHYIRILEQAKNA